MAPEHVDTTQVEEVFRQVSRQAVATLVRVFGDISLAEDAVQDAFVVASDRWQRDGIPPNPAGWIITTARHRAIDVVRRASRGRELEHLTATDPALSGDQEREMDEEGPVADDQLRLMFTCCHPALRLEHQVALTLRLLGGLSVAEVARSFLVSEPAMAKRLTRAKYKIKAATIPYRIPADADLPGRLQAVLTVLSLIYNTGVDDRDRASLRSEGVRLVRVLVDLMPDEPEVSGLLALVLLNEARMPARLAGEEVIVLKEQDRSLWDRTMIEEGHAIVRACIRRGRPGPFQLQAAIQAVHCAAATFEATDWAQIVTLYDQLLALSPTPVVALNRAIAFAEIAGPEAALRDVDELKGDLSGYHLFHATRGTLLRSLGRHGESAVAFRSAADLVATEPERVFLERQAGGERSAAS